MMGQHQHKLDPLEGIYCLFLLVIIHKERIGKAVIKT